MSWKRTDTWLVVRRVGGETLAEIFSNSQESAARRRLEELKPTSDWCRLDHYVGWRALDQ